jgi:anti-sigma-K factor RskA
MTHKDLIDSAAAYALGALDGGERQAFEAHLPGCPECQAEVDAYNEVTGLLAHAAPGAAPPNAAALRARIVSQANGVRPIGTARRVKRPLILPVWIAAAACLLLAIGLGAMYRSERGRVAQLQADLASARTDLAVRDSTLAAFLGPEVHVVSLAQPQEKPSARVYWNHTRNVFIVTAFALPRAPQGKTYQMWAMRAGKAPLSMGTFNTDANGRATVVVSVDQTITDGGFIDDCAVTLEPEGGSPQPTEAPRLVGPWRHVD